MLPLLIALALFAGVEAAPAHSGTPTVVKATQKVATLFKSQEALSKPARGSASLGLVPATRPLTGARTILPVLGQRAGAKGLRWLHVLLPGRPNGHSGWIKQRDTVVSTTGWHIVVDTAARRVTVYRNGRPVRVVKAVIGKPSTPTPSGEFFVEEAILLRGGEPGGPFALALSARSTVFQEFEGGPGQIALHGLMNVGGVPGTAASHGCVRLDNATMLWLVHRVGPGVPVTIK